MAMEIQIEFVSSEVLAPLGGGERIDFILNSIKNDRILVLDERLSSADQKELIAETMRHISKRFPGIEISTLGVPSKDDFRSALIRLLGGRVGGLTIIGPSRLIKQIKRDPHKIRLLARGK